jgi:hypothetical protein
MSWDKGFPYVIHIFKFFIYYIFFVHSTDHSNPRNGNVISATPVPSLLQYFPYLSEYIVQWKLS